jgi:ABC-2 type transport system ATP-binding protein
VIRVRGLSKRYGPKLVLHSIDLDVGPGEMVAVIGPNGAGKTTMLRVLGGSVLPDAGSLTVAGHDLCARRDAAARAGIGLVIGEERSFFWRLSGQQNLEFFAALHGYRRREARLRAETALAQVDLGSVARQRVDRYSTGMRDRLGIARALLGQPRVLLLDEPTRSLDPLSAASVQSLLSRLSLDGAAVLCATHNLDEAAGASRVLVLKGGSLSGRLDRPSGALAVERLLHEALR